MKIALLGYGKMGKTIERIALERGHEITIKTSDEDGYDITKADVAIDFSVPNAAFFNVVNCFKHNVPVVSGTTGWLHNYDKAVALCKETDGAFIYASNFSLGVNIFFELNKTLARMMGHLKNYNVSMEEIHHTQKLDAPSGTAITLAEGIISEHPAYSEWTLETKSKGTIPITAKRIENVPGTHSIDYKSDTDTISITHTAHSREGFALGAVIAAEWLQGKTGVFSMKDVLNIG
ncbi:dihydrodipicolinate reductase [Mangrovimonas yunxiaonensis]|uniref:4-hydroxy-tetrahydrodipicolinate reductase n=1 Tax=Mangrovimonas yunxiaonensis TaxID=1197477 RepID=A0A084TNM9_9FLAO|nr:4-hydroxy-tetrahydrodipicolinate reductase [Mangrovimonas yunxiaonensis]KFB02315.1 dihydrodipicolinate reductase [Mangrovimonas yunxiaonensis]MBR9756480.1 4-hydroxy-tetrahydrodipicolinate reductase [Algicola sp.]GGH39606.1 4-hydroxy-tetrahydrodipicolinate reductase [Mangrovimonas yunxiaonensis]